MSYFLGVLNSYGVFSLCGRFFWIEVLDGVFLDFGVYYCGFLVSRFGLVMFMYLG